MRKAFVVAAFCAAYSCSVSAVLAQANNQPAPNPAPAQSNPPAQNAPNNNAVNSPGGNNAAAPVAGANSFTEAQARSRIESQGYTNVSGLAKDGNGVWRGNAMKDGKNTNVSLDFQGNIFAR